VVWPVAENEIVHEHVANLPTIVILTAKIWDKKWIASQLQRSIQKFPLPAARQRGEKYDR
jgi:hypothetical protein